MIIKFFVTFLLIDITLAKVKDINLALNTPKRFVLHCNNDYRLKTVNVPPAQPYVLFQAHTQWHDVILSLDNSTSFGTYRQGANVGIYRILENGETNATVSLQCITSTATSVAVLLFAQVPGPKAPMPGGCNMEFPLKYDPNVEISYQEVNNIFKVAFQYANTDFNRGGTMPPCETTDETHKSLEYQLYQYWLKDLDMQRDSYFDTLSKILTEWNQNFTNTPHIGYESRQVLNEPYNGHTIGTFGAHRKQGVIYYAVVSETVNGTKHRALYVPTHTYGCSSRVNCIEFTPSQVMAYIVLLVIGVYGLFVAFFGHRYFMTGMFMFGHLAVMIALLLILLRYSSLSMAEVAILSSLLAISGGAAWALLWYYRGMPLVAIILPSFVMGFVFASIFFVYTPIGDFDIWKDPITFGLGFAAAVLILPVALIYFTKVLSIVCCASVGSFIMIWAASMFLGGSFKYIIPDTLHALTSTSFLQADNYLPFTMNDAILCCILVALFALALCVQLYREKGRPPFPPCPYAHRKQLQAMRELQQSPIGHAPVEKADGFGNETDPLLYPGVSSLGSSQHTHRSERSGHYGTTSGAFQSQIAANNEIIDPI